MANKNRNYIIAAVVVIVIVILLIVFTGKEAPPEPEPVKAPAEPKPAPVEAPVEEPVEQKAPEVKETVTESGEVIQMGGQTNIEVSDEFIVYNPGGAVPVEKTEGESWFTAITCQHAELQEGEKSSEKLDKLSFKITNKAEKEFVLRYVKYGEPDFGNAMRVQINGRRIRDAEVACGKDTIKPGETLFCQNAEAYLRQGESYTGKALVNSVASETTHFTSKVVFTC